MANLINTLQEGNSYELAHILQLVLTTYPEVFQEKLFNIPIFNSQATFLPALERNPKTRLIGRKFIPWVLEERFELFLQNRSVFALIHAQQPVFILFNQTNPFPIQLATSEINSVCFASDLSRVFFYSRQGCVELFVSNLLQRVVEPQIEQFAAAQGADGNFMLVDNVLQVAVLGNGIEVALTVNTVELYGEDSFYELPFEAISMRVNGFNIVICGGSRFVLLGYDEGAFSLIAEEHYESEFSDYITIGGHIYLLLKNRDFGMLEEGEVKVLESSIACIAVEGEEAVWGALNNEGDVEIWRGVFA